MPRGRWASGRASALARLAGLGAVTATAWWLPGAGADGDDVRHVLSGVLLLVVAGGPLLLGARPGWLWGIEAVGGASLLVAAVSDAVPVRIGTLRLTDLTYFIGYALVIGWLVLLNRHIRGRDSSVVLDTISVTAGSVVIVWTTLLVPLVGDLGVPEGILWIAYPTVDIGTLALTLHLAFRLPLRIPSLRWLLTALVLQLVSDSAYWILLLLDGGVENRTVTASYLIGYYCFAMAASHPSVVELSRPPLERARNGARGRTSAVTVLTISPALLAIAMPTGGEPDVIARVVLVLILLVVVFIRLTSTMRAIGAAEAAQHHEATHDELTGLLNRAALVDHLTQTLHHDRERGRATAVLFIDCDEFKHVNDTWGHQAGDHLLRDVAARLPGVLGPSDVLARHGGDEFVIVGSVAEPGEVVELAERVTGFFSRPVAIMPGRTHHMTASIGIAVAGPDTEVEPDQLLGDADVAMYEAKERGHGGYVVFGGELASRAHYRADVGRRLGKAIESGTIRLCLQPVMAGADYERLVGWEALARWDDPELGVVPPDVFIGVAEQLGLICDLGDFVLRRACHELAMLRATGRFDGARISVNVSPAHITMPGFVDGVRDALDDAGVPAQALWLEVTETTLASDSTAVAGVLDAVRGIGVRVAIDDFGSGYASLSTLMQLPVDCVKLDRSFVARLGVEQEAHRQLGAVMALIESLGIEHVLAEGVETAEQAAHLRRLGCPVVQGWLYGQGDWATDVPVTAHCPHPSSSEPAPSATRT